MAKDRNTVDYGGPLRRLVLAVLVLALSGTFLLWRIDSPRVERFRAQVTDAIVPNMDWAMAPVTGTINLVRDFQSYRRIAEQNTELRRELRQMQAWKEAALQLYRHNQYCHQQGWRMVPKTNPLVRLVDNYPTALLRWFDACDRLGRKLSRTSEKIPTCKGLKLRLPSQQDNNFAQQIGITAS